MTDAESAEVFELTDNRDWSMREARRQLRNEECWEQMLIQCLYRPLDWRPCYFSTVAMDYPRREMLDHVANKENLCLGLGRQGIAVQDPVWSLVAISKHPVDANVFRRGGINVFPLWIYPQKKGLTLYKSRRQNFSPAFVRTFASALGVEEPEDGGLPSGVLPEHLVHYIFGIFHSLAYRIRYAEFLKIDFPRLPVPATFGLFFDLARLGGELVALHLLESCVLNTSITTFSGPANPAVEKVSYTRDTVWLDKAQTRGFRGVPETVWNFHIGGYQVCEKWLKDRKGRTLSEDDIAHYQKIVVALAETIRLMREIDEVIEQYGGWPGAFAQRDAEARETADPDNVVPLPRPTPAVFAHQPAPLSLQKVAEPEAQRYEATDTSVRFATRLDPDDVDPEDLICRIRHMFGDGEERERNAAIDTLARELGYHDAANRIHKAIENALHIAIGRSILANEGDTLRLSGRNIDHYERNVLKEQFLASLSGRPWIERDEAIRAFARWMGFRRTGRSIDETARSLMNGLLREGRLERQGQLIRRSG